MRKTQKAIGVPRVTFRGCAKMVNIYHSSPLTQVMVTDEFVRYCEVKRKQLLKQAEQAQEKHDNATAEYKFCKVKLFTQLIQFLRGLESDILNGTDEKGA
jgi:hypothetical protein